jgi:hypothetical protein
MPAIQNNTYIRSLPLVYPVYKIIEKEIMTLLIFQPLIDPLLLFPFRSSAFLIYQASTFLFVIKQFQFKFIYLTFLISKNKGKLMTGCVYVCLYACMRIPLLTLEIQNQFLKLGMHSMCT